MSAILAIDLGGTRCRIGVASAAEPGAVHLVANVAAPTTRADFLVLVQTHLDQSSAQALGLGIPGLAENSTCRWVPNLPYLDGLDLAAVFPTLSIGLGNDAQLGLLAEVRAGAAIGLRDAILLAIGTGIGSAVLAGGSIVGGTMGAACSFGWASLDVNDPGEDVSGWLERHCSGRALDRLAQARGLADGTALIAQARAGDDLARQALDRPMQILGTALAGPIALLAPKAVILAGGVADAFDVLAPLIESALVRHLPPHLRQIELLAARHGPGAGLIGAAFAGAAGPAWRTTHG
ncbi:MAG TPA: ROK family protein [Devosia sp.]|nr:ROK family protein [Devosia sp.]